MDQNIFIASVNIDHFRRKLAGVINDDQRRVIQALLVEEEAKLTVLMAQASKQKIARLLDILSRRVSCLLRRAEGGGDTREHETHIVHMLESMPCAAGILDAQGRLILSNPAMRRFVPGHMPTGSGGQFPRWRIVDDKNGVPGSLDWPGAHALQGETVTPGIEAIFSGEDGGELHVRVAAAPVRRVNGDVGGAVSVIYDVHLLEDHDFFQDVTRLLDVEEGRYLR